MQLQKYSQSDIAAEVRAELARQNISRRGLARRMGVSNDYVARRIAGRIPISADDLRTIAFLLGVPISRFYQSPALEVTR